MGFVCSSVQHPLSVLLGNQSWWNLSDWDAAIRLSQRVEPVSRAKMEQDLNGTSNHSVTQI